MDYGVLILMISVGAFLGGLAVVVVLVFRQGGSATKQDFTSVEDELRNKVRSLQSKVLSMGTIDEDFPVAMWSKTVGGVITNLNNICYTIFIAPSGISLAETYGLTDHDIFDKETADVITKNDQLVIQAKVPMMFIETLTVDNVTSDWVVIRIPILNDKGEVILMKGMAHKQVKLAA